MYYRNQLLILRLCNRTKCSRSDETLGGERGPENNPSVDQKSEARKGRACPRSYPRSLAGAMEQSLV